MTRSVTAAVAVVLIIGVSALAGDPDIDFASMLLEEFGYADLVTEFLLRITSNKKHPESKRANAHAALADAYMKMADKAMGDAKQELYKKAEEHLAVVQKMGGADVGDAHEVQKRVADIQRDNAQRLKSQAEKEGVTPEEKDKILQQAREMMDAAIKRYDAIYKALKKKYDDAEEKNVAKDELNAIKETYGMPWFSMLSAMRMKAQMMGEAEKKKALDVLGDKLDEFTSEFSGWGFEFYGNLLKGGCQKDAGEYEGCVGTMDFLLEDLKTRKIEKELRDVVQKAMLQKAEAYAEWAGVDKSRADEHGKNALEMIKAFFKKYPKVAKPKKKDTRSLDLKCYAMKVEVKALMYMGESGRALDKATWIFENGTPGARNLISEDLAELKGVAIAGVFFFKARRELAVAQDLYKKGLKKESRPKFRQALGSYQQFINAATDGDILANGPTAWLHMGNCYYFLEEYLSAAVAFHELVRVAHYVAKTVEKKDVRKKAVEQEELGLDLRTKCLSKVYKASKENAWAEKEDRPRREFLDAIAGSDLRRWQRAMIDFVERFSKSRKSIDMYYYIADTFRQQGDFEKAEEYLKKVAKRSRYYDDAQYMIPVVMWKKYEKLRDAEGTTREALEKCLDEIASRFELYLRMNKTQQKKAPKDKLAKLRRNQAQAETILAQAGIELMKMEARKENPDPKEIEKRAKSIIKALAGFEDRHPEKKTFENVWITRIQAFEKLDDVEGADGELQKLLEKKSRFCRDGLAILANMWIKRAKKETSPDMKRECNRRAAAYFEKLIAIDPDQTMDTIEWVADQLFQMAEEQAKAPTETEEDKKVNREGAKELYERATRIYGTWLLKFEKDKETPKDRTLTIYYKVFLCYMGMDKLDIAEQYLNKLLQDKEWQKDWTVKRAQVQILHAKAGKAEGDAKAAVYAELLQTLAENLSKLPSHGDEWWWCKEKVIEIFLEMGKYGISLGRVEVTEELYKWGSMERRKRMADLLERYIGRLKRKTQKKKWREVIDYLRKEVEIPRYSSEEEEPAEGEAAEPGDAPRKEGAGKKETEKKEAAPEKNPDKEKKDVKKDEEAAGYGRKRAFEAALA